MARFTRIAVLGCAIALAGGADAADAEDPAKLPLVSLAIIHLKDHYLDPQRFEPKKMVVAAVEQLSQTVDELVFEGDAAAPTLTLRMGADTREIDLAPVTSLWAIRPALQQVLGFVRERASVGADELERAALAGMLSTLDPNTTVLGPKESRELLRQLRGGPAGVGLVIGLRRGQVQVVKVFRGGTAAQLGLRPGDVLREIDGRSTAGVALQEIVERLRGPNGSELALEWTRPGEPPHRATARREPVVIPAVSAQLLPGAVAYVRLTEFHGHTPRELARELKAHAERAGRTLRGVILDVRGSPGGLLEAARGAADVFLSEGEVTDVVDAGGTAHQALTARPSSSDVSAPVVVLVDERSAGAAEILAAALREHGRAIVVGRRTFGLAAIHQVVALDDAGDHHLKIMVGARRTADGRRFDGVGIQPDVVVRPACVAQGVVRGFAPEPDATEGEGPLGFLTDIVGEDRLDREERASDPSSCEPRWSEELAGADPAVAFAARVLEEAATPDREGLRAAAAKLLPGTKPAADEELAALLAPMGVDWSHAEPGGSPVVTVTAAGPKDGTSAAGAPIFWPVTVENRGPGPLSRLRAWTVAPHARFLDGRELVFGTIPPGAKRSFTLRLYPLGNELTPRRDEVTLRFAEENGNAPAEAEVRFELRKVVRPRLSFQARLGCATPGCAPVGAGAAVKVDVAVRNSGRAPSPAETIVKLEPLDERMYVQEGWREIGAIAPGGQKHAPLAFRLLEAEGDARVRFKLAAFTADSFIACALDPAIGARLPLVRECRSPVLRLSPDPDAGVVVAAGERFRLEVTVPDAGGADPVRRVTVRLGDRKVLVQRAGEGAKALAFSAELRLQPGENLVVVQAETRAGNLVVQPMRIYR